MKRDLTIFFKKNYFFPALLIFAYLIYSVNNNLYESFVIFFMLIIGYFLVNYKIFYILLLLIIISNIFLYFNKIIEGNDNCQYIDNNINKYVNKKSQQLSGTKNSHNRNYYNTVYQQQIKSDTNNVSNTARETSRNNRLFSRRNENSSRSDISKSCAKNMTEPQVEIQRNNYQSNVCPMPASSELTQSNIANVSVRNINE
jgi:hypothetical protein